MQLEDMRKRVRVLFPYLWIFGSYAAIDVWLRVMTRWINRYSIYAPEPNLFTVLWAVLLTVLVTAPRSRKTGRTLYGITYYLFLVYAVVQYGSYLVLGNFLWVSDFLNAGEGADYASWVAGFISPSMILQILLLVGAGIGGILLFPGSHSRSGAKEVLTRGVLILAVIAALQFVPRLYSADKADAGTFNDPALEYERFSNANYDLELAGTYQYLAKDITSQLSGMFFVDTEAITRIDAFFAEKTSHQNNALTGVFAGKNLIVIQLETIDDWMITLEDTPTLYRLMNDGINFTNLYTPGYASGYTFNTEFAFNTSIYPYSNGNVTYSLVRNTFRYSIGNVFADAGYSVNSFHAGAATFYNRSEIHQALGYEQYHSYKDYPEIATPTADDCFLTQSDPLYAAVTGNAPFYSYVISFSAHLPYTDDDTLSRYALDKYPQYDVQADRELNILRAKARLTDDMVAQLLARLEADGLLEDTVIAAFTDHYAYGLSNQQLLRRLSEESGSSILERTPAFIYCAGMDLSATVAKVVQITDLAPTIMNLFGFDVPTAIMGQDILDENYAGFAIFPDGTWLTSDAYVKNGVVMRNAGMSETEIAQMNRYVQEVYQINDALLDTDYYK